MEMALVQARMHTHILKRPLDLRAYVSLDCSFRTQYLYYISAVSHRRAALSIFFFVSSLAARWEYLWMHFHSINFGPALLNRLVLYVSFDPLFLSATSRWLGIDRGDFVCQMARRSQGEMANGERYGVMPWAQAKNWYPWGKKFGYRLLTAASDGAFILTSLAHALHYNEAIVCLLYCQTCEIRVWRERCTVRPQRSTPVHAPLW